MPGSAIVTTGRLLILGLELLGSNGAGVTQDMASGLAVRVLALGALGNLHAGKLTSVLLNIGNRGTTDVGGNGMKALGALRIVLNVAQNRDVGHAEHIREVMHQHGVVGKVAIGDDGKRGAILNKRYAVAVENATAHGRRGDGAGLVALGLFIVIVRRDHLHTPQLDGKRGKHRAHTRGEDGEAPLKRRRGRIALALGGARSRSVLRVIGKTGIAAAHNNQRDNNGHDQHDTGDDDRYLGRHLWASPI